NEPLDLGELKVSLPKDTKLRWINFRRRVINIVQPGNTKREFHYNVIGWQTTINGKNIQRMIAINSSGEVSIWNEDQKGIVEATERYKKFNKEVIK
ncbi:MAG: hypothetical protein ACTSO3_15290, partial [Candidatus Heimdallarchaeaceae archaeon]